MFGKILPEVSVLQLGLFLPNILQETKQSNILRDKFAFFNECLYQESSRALLATAKEYQCHFKAFCDAEIKDGVELQKIFSDLTSYFLRSKRGLVRK